MESLLNSDQKGAPPAAPPRPAPIERGVLLSGECRFQVGGPADFFCRAATAHDVYTALDFANRQGLRHFVYAGGSNLFFSDGGFRGLVVRLQGGAWRIEQRLLPPGLGAYAGRDSVGRGALEVNETSMPGSQASNVEGRRSEPDLPPSSDIRSTGDSDIRLATSESQLVSTSCVSVDAGYDLPQLVRELAERDLGGVEWLGNIPGSIGGAVVGNAGCYGRAIAEVLVEAQVLHIPTLTYQRVEPAFFEFAYRHSQLKYNDDYVLLSALLRLQPRPRAEILSEVEGELAERRRKHPHDAACAGSFFKNPSREQPAWKVITAAGLANAEVGGARLHEKHANFLVNAGGAGSSDIIALAQMVRLVVEERLGLSLEPEVRYIGPEGVEEIWP
ncbi:UDP-N-acetylmuramate dehydrogenase [bacterium]|nr:UDP-N-acetylmuramate dehydrogenase [bacterium]